MSSYTTRQARELIEGELAYVAKVRPIWEENRRLFTERNDGAGQDDRVNVHDLYGQSVNLGRDEISGLSLDTNQITPNLTTLASNIVPLHPSASIESLLPEKDTPAQIRSALVNHAFDAGGLKWRLRRAAILAELFDRSFLKVVWSKERQGPRYSVLGPDRVLHDRRVAFWDELPWLCEIVVVDTAEMKRRLTLLRADGTPLYDKEVLNGCAPEGFPSDLLAESISRPADASSLRYYTIYEFYDFNGQALIHFLGKGSSVVKAPLMTGNLPFKSVRNNFRSITLEDNSVNTEGLGSAGMIKASQQVITEIDATEMEFIHATIPFCGINSSLVDDPDMVIAALNDKTSAASAIEMRVKDGAPLNAVIQWSQSPGIQPDFERMRARAETDIQFKMGIPPFVHGQMGESGFATEVAKADSHLRTRLGWKAEAILEATQWAAEVTIGLYEEFLSPDSPIYVKLAGTGQRLAAFRADLDPQDWETDGHKPMEYRYNIVPYSPSANNPILQLNHIERNLPVLLQLPNVDKAALTRRFLDLLGLQGLYLAETTPPVENPNGGNLPNVAPETQRESVPMDAEGGPGHGAPLPGGQDTGSTEGAGGPDLAALLGGM